MNTDKLLKAIQILIREEVNEQLPKLVKKEILKLNEQRSVKSTKKPDNTNVTYTKNSMINDILNETRLHRDDEFRTLNFDQSNVTDVSTLRSRFASQLGYEDMQPMTMQTLTGTPVDTNNDAVKNVMSAMNRDYSELVKRF